MRSDDSEYKRVSYYVDEADENEDRELRSDDVFVDDDAFDLVVSVVEVERLRVSVSRTGLHSRFRVCMFV